MPLNITGGGLNTLSNNSTITIDDNTALVSRATGTVIDAGSTILQTVFLRYDQRTTWSAPVSASTIVSDLNLSITPMFATSRILITYMLSFEVHHDTVFRLGRNNVELVRNNTDGGRWSGWANPGYDQDTDSTPKTTIYMHIDSPATTSTITYNLMVGSSSAAAYTLCMNRNVGNVGSDDRETGISYVMLQEIK